MTDGALPKGLTVSRKLRHDAPMAKSAKGKAGKANPNLATVLRREARRTAPEELEPRAEPIPPAALSLANALREAGRARAAGSLLPESPTPSPTGPTLCVHLRGSIPEIQHEPRLKRLPWTDRSSLFYMAGHALGLTPVEYLDAISILFMSFMDEDVPPRTREQYARIARILRALYDDTNTDRASFIGPADVAARTALNLKNGDSLLTDRDAVLEHIRDQVVTMLEQEYETERISFWLGLYVADSSAFEVARHIPKAAELLYREERTKRASDAMHRAREGKRGECDVQTRAECMIRAWLRKVGYPAAKAKCAFDAERARVERKDGKRRKRLPST